jgi:hypothetical protein
MRKEQTRKRAGDAKLERDIRKMMPWVVCCFFSLGAVRDPFLVFNRCTLWCAFKWKATLLLCICRPVSCKKNVTFFLNEKFL